MIWSLEANRFSVVALVLIAVSLCAAASTHRVTVKLVGDRRTPVANIDVLLCPGVGPRCIEAATANRHGIAQFQNAPYEQFDLRSKELTEPLVLHLPASSTLRVHLLERLPGDATRPLKLKEVSAMLHESPPKPHGAGVSSFSHFPSTPEDHFELCLVPNSADDIEAEVPGFCLASAHVEPLKPFEMKKVELVMRAKPKP